MTEQRCTSCNTSIGNQKGIAIFKCPGCSKQEIIRCKHCRELATKYACPACNFEGPN